MAGVWEDRTEHFLVRSPLPSVAREPLGVGRRIQTPDERENTKGFEHRKRLARRRGPVRSKERTFLRPLSSRRCCVRFVGLHAGSYLGHENFEQFVLNGRSCRGWIDIER
jgi:hypothetical protein